MKRRAKRIGGLLWDAGNRFQEDRANLLSGAIAFYTMLSLAPVLVIAVSVAGVVFGDRAVQREVLQLVRSSLGKDAAELVAMAMDHAAVDASGWALLLGIGLTFFGASRMFIKLQEALNSLWGIRDTVESFSVRGFLGPLFRKRLLAFGTILIVGVLIAALLLAKLIIAGLDQVASQQLPSLTILWRLLELAVSIALTTVMFGIVFKFFPDVEIPWNAVWVGAGTTAVLFNLGLVIVSAYFGYGTTSSLPGAAGTLMAMLLWIYYSANVFFFGVELSRAWLERRGEHAVPEDHVAVQQHGPILRSEEPEAASIESDEAAS